MAAAKGESENDRAGNQPDGDLRQPDGAHADQLARQHVAGLGDRQHHFEDARGLFLDDGAGDVHAVNHGRHRKQNGHDVALPERGRGIALHDAAVFLHLEGLQMHAIDQLVGVVVRHAAAVSRASSMA